MTVKVSPSRTAARVQARAGPGPGGAGQLLVQVDAVGGDAEGGELLALGGEVLAGGAAPGVADNDAHSWLPSCHG